MKRPSQLVLKVLAALTFLVTSGASVRADDVVEYVVLDGLGNVRVVEDEKGNVLERHDYLAFGEECTTGKCASNPGVGAGEPLKFTGKERDQETGLDYFGARYYGSKIDRFTTVDPVLNQRAALVDPQRWNRYTYARNNPLRYVDPEGREITYATPQLQTFFGFLSARSATVRDTLGLYTGPGRPDLFIRHADAGRDIDGSKNAGSFTTTGRNFEVDYAGKEDQIRPGMTVEQIEDLGTWRLVGQTTLTLDSSLTINVQDKGTIRASVHEVGHADQAARQPLQYKRDAAVERDPNGRIIPHDKRPAEVYANKYRDRAVKEVNP